MIPALGTKLINYDNQKSYTPPKHFELLTHKPIETQTRKPLSRFHHIGMGLIHIPVAILEVAAAALLTIPCCVATTANSLTLHLISPLNSLTSSINTQMSELLYSIGHSIAQTYLHALRAINPHAKKENNCNDLSPSVKSLMFITAELFSSLFGRWDAFFLTLPFIFLFAPISPLLDLAALPITILLPLITLGSSKKINTLVYEQILSVASFPRNLHACAMHVIDTHSIKYT